MMSTMRLLIKSLKLSPAERICVDPNQKPRPQRQKR